MKLNTPTYRAKEKYSEVYIVGYIHPTSVMCLRNEYCNVWRVTEVDPSTLAINFPDMLDSENNPIFASLSEDGKGGDLVKLRYSNKDKGLYETVAIYNRKKFCAKFNKTKFIDSASLTNAVVIGIQK